MMALAFVSGCGYARSPGSQTSQAEKPSESPPAEFVNYTEKVVGRDGTAVTFEMIAVPGGSFLMGSPDSEAGRKKDEGPQHKMTVGPFWISKTEVTCEEYEAFGYPYRPKSSPWMEKYVDGVTCPTMPWGDPYRGFGRDSKPVVGVSWYGAIVYCRWLSRRTKKLYRLPTEAEWEYACRAGSKGKFCFGDDESKLGEYAWYKAKSKHETHRVATKKPNAWGIYDMHGNVSEWCLDWYKPDYYGSVVSGEWTKDPQGPDSGENHVIRGGHFETAPSGLRCAGRDVSKDWWLKLDPQDPKSHWWLVPTSYLGFRIVRPVHGKEPPFPSMQNGL